MLRAPRGLVKGIGLVMTIAMLALVAQPGCAGDLVEENRLSRLAESLGRLLA